MATMASAPAVPARLALAAAAALAAGCASGAAAREARILERLRGLEPILESDVPAPFWLAEGLAPLREGLEAIRRGGVAPVPAEEARAAVDRARVVVVADLHHLDPCRFAFRRIVEELAGRSALREGRVSLGFEALPASFQPALDAAVGERRREAALDLLRAGWPWPVDAYGAILGAGRLRACPLLALGDPEPPRALPAAGPDAARRPVPLSMTVEEFKYGFTFGWKNLHAAQRVAAEGRTFVLYGAAHALGPGGIRARLLDAGVPSVVLVPFLPEWEIALRERFGRAARSAWFEVQPGVWRAPMATEEEILALPSDPRAPSLIVLPP